MIVFNLIYFGIITYFIGFFKKDFVRNIITKMKIIAGNFRFNF